MYGFVSESEHDDLLLITFKCCVTSLIFCHICIFENIHLNTLRLCIESLEEVLKGSPIENHRGETNLAAPQNIKI